MSKRSLSTNDMELSDEDFEAMYKSNAPLIYRFLFWRTKDEMLAEDLTSRVFEKAWQGRTGFSGGSMKSWLYKIAHNTLIDHWRKRKEVPLTEAETLNLVSDEAATDELLDQAASYAAMYTAITQLSPIMRRVVRLRFLNGLSTRQTARRLGLSEANVRVIQYRALKQLRERLE